MNKILDTLHSEGFTSVVELLDGPTEIVRFIADLDVDADGANGQNGKPAAYVVGDHGSEALANGGMGMRNGRVVGVTDWYDDIVILGADKQPKVFPGGVIASKTAYRFQGKDVDDPTAYLDAATVRYIVVPPVVISKTKGAVLGCYCTAENLRLGNLVEGVVGDSGPRDRDGEGSIFMSEALGLPSSPRNGGTEKPIIRYTIYPGRRGKVYGREIPLMTSKGTYL